jgi:hypothetical protein
MKTDSRTGGSVELGGRGDLPRYGGANIEIRGGGLPERKSGMLAKIPPGLALSFLSTVLIAVSIFGILTGAGVILPWYSWLCVGLLVGVINPMGRPRQS